MEALTRLSSSKVSVVIPTLNAGSGFEELLKGLFVQEARFDYEVLVIDSGSTDGTAELARRYGASVHRISEDEFDHGATRNLGVSLSGGEYVAFIVQDAMPLDEAWLAAMVEKRDGMQLLAPVGYSSSHGPPSAARQLAPAQRARSLSCSSSCGGGFSACPCNW